MRRRALVVCFLVYCVLAGSPRATFAEPTKEEQCIQQLENRIVDLEKTVKQLQAQVKVKLPAKSDLDKKLVGNWAVTKRTKGRLTGLRLESDGTCHVAAAEEEVEEGKYTVVGKTISFKFGPNLGFFAEVESVTEKELVIRTRLRTLSKAEEIRFERQ